MATRRRNNRAGKLLIFIIVVCVLVAMGVQIFRLKSKTDLQNEKLADLQKQYEQETQRASELADREAYMKTTQYIEDLAKSKLGLAYDNEIIFKESDE